MITTKKYTITILLLIVLAGGLFFTGLKLGKKGFIYSGHDFKIINQNSQPANVDYGLLWQALDLVNAKFIDKPIDQQKLLYGSISGLVNALGDPYTTFFNPKDYQDFKTELSGSFEGIGAEVGIKNNQIVIIAPLEGSPAKQAGLLSGDIILKIDGADATSLTLEQAVNKIRGPKGTQVKLSLYRESAKKQIDFTITRATIDVVSVKYSSQSITAANGKPKNIEVINVQRFGDDTVSVFAKAAADALAHNAAGIVLDLRDDPGGYLDSAVSVASYWIPSGQLVVSEARSDGSTQKYTASGNNILHNIPTIVLINSGSASAAEILSGALHDDGFAKLVGEKSFGKGSVQELINLTPDTAVKITVAKWLTPNGINLNHNGLDPDIKVTRTPDQITLNQDPQMDQAVNLLK